MPLAIEKGDGTPLRSKNTAERVMARRCLPQAPAQVRGYVVADANFDSHPLHGVCGRRGNRQLVTRRRYGPVPWPGHKAQAAGGARDLALRLGGLRLPLSAP